MVRCRIFHFALPVLVVFATFVFSPDSLAQQEGVHTLQGKVSLPNNLTPPNPVKVTLTFNGRRIYETFTDLSGRFSFAGIRRGTYELRAEGDGDAFETTTIYAEVSAFGNAPQTFTQNVQLRLKPGKSLPTTGIVSAEDVDAKIPNAARKEFEKGVKRANDNKPEQALKHFQDAIASYPAYYVAITAMAEQYSKLQQYEECVTNYKKAIEMKPDRPEAHTGLGMAMVKQQKYKEAIAPLRRGAELDKQSFTPHLFLGLSEMMIGDYIAAETDLLRAYDMGKPAIAHLYLANLYDLRGEPQKAIERLEIFLRENPNMPENRKIEIREVMEKLRKQVKEKK